VTLTDATHAGLPCVASFIVLLGLLTCDPFTDIGGTVSELDSISFGGRHERHCIAIDQKNVLEIDGGDGATLMCEDASEYVQILHGNPTADDQDHAIVISHQTVDSAAHFGGVFSLSRKRKPDATCSRENTAKTGCGAECDVAMPGESGESGYCGDSGGDSRDSNDGVSRNLNCLLLIARALIR